MSRALSALCSICRMRISSFLRDDSSQVVVIGSVAGQRRPCKDVFRVRVLVRPRMAMNWSWQLYQAAFILQLSCGGDRSSER